MAGPRIIYSFSFVRELNLHRSKEQLEKEYANIEELTSEFVEYTSRMHKDLKKYLSVYSGIKTVDIPEHVYVVTRDRGLSFSEPMTVVYSENQKLMFARYVCLLCQRLFDTAEAAVLLTRAICSKLPINFERELNELETEQHITMPMRYDLTEKPLKKWLK